MCGWVALSPLPVEVNRRKQHECVVAGHIDNVIKQAHWPLACPAPAGVCAASLQNIYKGKGKKEYE